MNNPSKTQYNREGQSTLRSLAEINRQMYDCAIYTADLANATAERALQRCKRMLNDAAELKKLCAYARQELKKTDEPMNKLEGSLENLDNLLAKHKK